MNVTTKDLARVTDDTLIAHLVGGLDPKRIWSTDGSISVAQAEYGGRTYVIIGHAVLGVLVYEVM